MDGRGRVRLNALFNVLWGALDEVTLPLGLLLVQLAVLAVLALARPRFTVLPSRLGVRQAVRIGGGAFAAWLVVGTVVVLATQERAGGLFERVWYAAAGTLVSVDSFVIFPDGVFVPGWVDVALNAAGTVLVLLVTWFLFQPAADPAALGADEDRLRHLLATEGEGDALGYFNLRRDKTAVFAPNGRAAVVHRVVGGVSVVSGDPGRQRDLVARGRGGLAPPAGRARVDPRPSSAPPRRGPRSTTGPACRSWRSGTRP